MEFDIGLITEIKPGNAVISRRYLMKNPSLKNSDPTQHEILFAWIPYVPGIVDIKNVHIILLDAKMQPSEAEPQRTAKSAALPTALVS